MDLDDTWSQECAGEGQQQSTRPDSCIGVAVALLPESWNSKIRSWVARNSEPRMTVLSRASSNLNALTGHCVSASTLVLNYGATNVAPIPKDQPLLSSKRRPNFQTRKWSWNERKFGHESRWDPTPRVTVVARPAAIYCNAMLGKLHFYSYGIYTKCSCHF
jgi:hypothetical protein